MSIPAALLAEVVELLQELGLKGLTLGTQKKLRGMLARLRAAPPIAPVDGEGGMATTHKGRCDVCGGRSWVLVKCSGREACSYAYCLDCDEKGLEPGDFDPIADKMARAQPPPSADARPTKRLDTRGAIVRGPRGGIPAASPGCSDRGLPGSMIPDREPGPPDDATPDGQERTR